METASKALDLLQQRHGFSANANNNANLSRGRDYDRTREELARIAGRATAERRAFSNVPGGSS